MNQNKKCCTGEAGNLGLGGCKINLEAIAGNILYREARHFTQAEIDDIENTLQNDTLLTSKAKRAYPIFDLFNVEDTSKEAAKEESPQTGVSQVTFEYDYSYNISKSGTSMQFNDGLQTFNTKTGAKPHVLLVDQGKKILMTKSNKPGFVARTIPLSYFHCHNVKAPTQTTTFKSMWELSFNNSYINKGNWVTVESELSDYEALKNMQIVTTSINVSIATRTLEFSVEDDSRCESFAVDNEAALKLAANYVATNTTTGLPLTISGIAFNASTGKFTATFAATNFPTVAPQSISFAFAAPSVMNASTEPMAYYEGVNKLIVLPTV